jgi:hypothetical protein
MNVGRKATYALASAANTLRQAISILVLTSGASAFRRYWLRTNKRGRPRPGGGHTGPRAGGENVKQIAELC